MDRDTVRALTALVSVAGPLRAEVAAGMAEPKWECAPTMTVKAAGNASNTVIVIDSETLTIVAQIEVPDGLRAVGDFVLA